MCYINIFSNLEYHLTLLLVAVSEDTHLHHISLVIVFVHLPRNDVMLLFWALCINRISTGCHCCSMQMEHKCASFSANFRNGPEPSGKAHHVL